MTNTDIRKLMLNESARASMYRLAPQHIKMLKLCRFHSQTTADMSMIMEVSQQHAAVVMARLTKLGYLTRVLFPGNDGTPGRSYYVYDIVPGLFPDPMHTRTR